MSASAAGPTPAECVNNEDLVVEVGGAHLNLRGEVNMRREIERYDIPVYAH